MKPAPWAVKNGLNDESVRMWLKGGRVAKVGSIKKLADALGCNIEDISYWEHTVDFDSISQKNEEIDEIISRWGYLSAQQRQSILMIVRTFAEPNMNNDDPDKGKV